MKIPHYYNISNVVFIVQQKKPEFITKRTLSKIRCKTQALISEVPLKHVLGISLWQFFPPNFCKLSPHKFTVIYFLRKSI